MSDPKKENDPDAPFARKRAPDKGKVDQLADRNRAAENRQEELIDEAVEETFPASDPPTPKHIT